jgi:uncharacterized protein
MPNKFLEYFEIQTKGKKEDSDQYRVAGYLSTFKNADRYGDVVDKDAFTATIKDIKKNRGGIIPMLMDHWANTRSQVGAWDKFKTDEKGLYVEGYIIDSKETEHTIKLIDSGAIRTLSMGGRFKYEFDKKGTPIIKEVDLYEGSIVVVPANPKAQFEKKTFLFDDAELATKKGEIEQPQNQEEIFNARIKNVLDTLKKKGL